jgi:ABC-2 type transport system permease protein
MIGRIARKEFTDLLRDGRFRFSALMVGALLLVSLGAGWTQVRAARAQLEAAQATARDHWDSQGQKNPHSAAHYGIYAFKPRLPLSFVDQGVDPWTGTSVWLEAHRQNDFLMRPAQDATAAQRFGTLTAAGVLQHLIPLLIILLAFGALAGEREQGTLRQVLASGVGRRQLVAGKALGVAGALALLVVPAALLGSAALVMGSSAADALAGRTVVLGLVYIAYFGAFVGLSLAVSAFVPSSRAALVTLLSVWVVNGLVAPRAAVDLSGWLHPAPTAFEFSRTIEQQMSTGVDGITPPDRQAITQQILDEYGVESVDELPVNLSGITLQASEEFGNQIYDRNYTALWDTFERQSRVHESLAVVAPLLAVRALSMGLAGTDVEQHRHFATAAETYRREIMRAMNGDLAQNSRTGETYLADDDLWESVPPLDYEAPDLAWVLGNRTLSLVILGLWLVGAIVAAVTGARRAEVA